MRLRRSCRRPCARFGCEYVALGSSFAAGAGIESTKAGPPQRCGRTVNNYATLLAAKLDLSREDRRCGGATTEHVLSRWNELPLQIDAVTPDARLVTITIGGNDLNYVGSLFAISCAARGGFEVGRKIACTPAKPPLPEDFTRAEANLRSVAKAVRTRAPRATIVFVQYVTLIPERLCANGPLSAGEAAATGFPQDGPDMPKGAPWHPDLEDHAAVADALVAMLKG